MIITKSRLIKTISILVTVVLFLYLYVHVTYTFRDPLAYTQEHLTGFYAEDKDTVDVIILGTSATFSAYMPMELWGEYGITAYDFCTNVMFEESMPYAIREFEKTQSPKLVVIDLAPFMYGHNSTNNIENEEHYRFNIDGYKLSKNRIDLINKLIVDDRDKLPYYLDLMYYHESYHPNIKFWNHEVHGIAKGYSNLQTEMMFPDATGRVSEEYLDKLVIPQDYEFPEFDENNFDTLLAELPKYDFEVLFTIDPYYVFDEKSLDYHYRARYLKDRIAAAGYNVLDMYEDYDKVGIDPTRDYSLDVLHFHVESAQKITHYLGRYIDDNYKLVDLRNNSKYNRWAEDYCEWLIKKASYEAWTRENRELYERR